MPITIKDIAALAGVSYQAVSAVLNNRKGSRVSEETRKKILTIAEEYGYRTNFGYQLMRGQAPGTVAVLISINYVKVIENTHKLQLLLMERFNDLGYATYAHTFLTDPVANLDKVRELINRGVSHFVFLGSPFGHTEIIQELDRSKLDYIATSPNFPRYVADSREGRLELLRNFRERFGENLRLIAQEREAATGGYLMNDLAGTWPEFTPDEIRDRLLFLIPEICYQEREVEMQLFRIGQEAALRAMSEHPGLKALIFMNDYFALGGAAALHAEGYQVGKEISVAGHDNVLAAQTSVLPISTVGFDFDNIARLLLEKVFGNDSCRIILPPRIIIRP